jgi:adenylate cyclase
LFVIARNSSFALKGTPVDIKEVGRRFGVRFVLEGSERKASGRVWVRGQLIDEVIGAHADRFERDFTDVFALQDEVSVSVVSIQPKLLQTEIAIAVRRRPENLTTYDFISEPCTASLRPLCGLWSFLACAAKPILQPI